MQDLSGYTKDYYLRETWFEDHGLLRPDQLAALCYALGRPFNHFTEEKPRDPGVIVSIGSGKGDLEAKLEELGYKVIGVDPSPGAKESYKGKSLQDKYEGGGNTIIFCEAVEHLPPEETRRILDEAPPGTRFVFTNWPDYFPLAIDPSGWDHITRVDDELYDRLTDGMFTIIRKGSHLVLEKPL